MVIFEGTPRTDAELLAAHIAGDPDAFTELFGRYRRVLAGLAGQRCRSPEDVDDVLQESMLAAHRGAGGFRHQAAVRSWLHRIVANACVDRHRANTRHATVPLDEALLPVTDRTAAVDTALLVHEALADLPVPQRATIVAVDMYGLTVAETARLLGVSEGTVKSRRSRARARLVSRLGPQL